MSHGIEAEHTWAVHRISMVSKQVPQPVGMVVLVVGGGGGQRAAGPGQHASPPSGVRQMQTWMHVPFTHASCVQPFPSSHSASV